VFARTKHGADRLAKNLGRAGVDVTRIHGDRTQGQRNQALQGFKDGQYRVLVATDVAARGIHVDNIAHVVNFDLPQAPEDFIHRAGRTGRAGSKGTASTFNTRQERGEIRRIERVINLKMTTMKVPAELPELPAPAPFRKEVPEVVVIATANKPERRDTRPPYAERRQFANDRERGSDRPKFHQSFSNKSARRFASDADAFEPAAERESRPAGSAPKFGQPNGQSQFGKPSFGKSKFGKPSNGEAGSSKSFGGKVSTPKTYGAKPFGAKSNGPKPFGAKPFAGKPFGNKANGKRRFASDFRKAAAY
jgi:superfamily II DNA/RNA helicase